MQSVFYFILSQFFISFTWGIVNHQYRCRNHQRGLSSYQWGYLLWYFFIFIWSSRGCFWGWCRRGTLVRLRLHRSWYLSFWWKWRRVDHFFLGLLFGICIFSFSLGVCYLCGCGLPPGIRTLCRKCSWIFMLLFLFRVFLRLWKLPLWFGLPISFTFLVACKLLYLGRKISYFCWVFWFLVRFYEEMIIVSELGVEGRADWHLFCPFFVVKIQLSFNLRGFLP